MLVDAARSNAALLVPPQCPQVREDELQQLCDGDSDSTGLQWPLHVRDRLPLDLLSCLPGAVKAVGSHHARSAGNAAAAVVASAVNGRPAVEGGAGDSATSGDGEAGPAAMHQFRPQIQVREQSDRPLLFFCDESSALHCHMLVTCSSLWLSQSGWPCVGPLEQAGKQGGGSAVVPPDHFQS